MESGRDAAPSLCQERTESQQASKREGGEGSSHTPLRPTARAGEWPKGSKGAGARTFLVGQHGSKKPSLSTVPKTYLLPGTLRHELLESQDGAPFSLEDSRYKESGGPTQ